MARKSRKQGEQPEPINAEPPKVLVGEYSRLSKEDIRKKQSDSIHTQQHLIEAYIAGHENMVLVERYSDVDYTGTNFNRPDFERMIADLKSGKINCVIVKDLSRFGRSFLETGTYLEKVFPFLGVRFISVNDEFDTLTADKDGSGYSVPLKNLMNEVYAKDISKKVQSTYATKRRRGDFCGAFAPYGYTKIGDSLELDEAVADNVRLIFQLVLDGYSDIAIAGKLNEMGIPSPSRYRFEQGIVKDAKFENTAHWYKSAIKRITNNPVYIGTLRSGKHRSAFLKGGGRVVMGDFDCDIHTGAHPAIITEEIYEAVQAIRAKRQADYHAKPQQKSTENIFKGLIVCGDCGAAMTRKKARSRYTFLCNVYEQVDKAACSKKYLREEDLKKAVYEAIRVQIALAVSIEDMLERLNRSEPILYKKSVAAQELQDTQQRLTRLGTLKSSLYGDYVDGILDKPDYLRLKGDYEKEIAELQKRLDGLREKQQYAESTISKENKWLAAFRRFEEEHELTAEMLGTLIQRIEVYEHDRISITFNYRDEYEAIAAYAANPHEIRRAV